MKILFFEGVPYPPYIVGGRVTGRLDLENNRQAIIDNKDHRILTYLIDHVVSSGYASRVPWIFAEQHRPPQGTILRAGLTLKTRPMFSAMGIRGQTLHS